MVPCDLGGREKGNFGISGVDFLRERDYLKGAANASWKGVGHFDGHRSLPDGAMNASEFLRGGARICFQSYYNMTMVMPLSQSTITFSYTASLIMLLK